MDVVGSMVSILSCLCSRNSLQQSLERQCKHLRKPKKNLNKLKELVEQLDARRSDVNTKLNQMWLEKGMNPREEVKLWMKSVDRVRIQVSSLTENNNGCSFNFLCSRIKFGGVVEEKISEVQELLDKGQFLDESVVAENLPKVGYTLPASPLMECATTMQSLMRILECLSQESAKRIGVYGMGGVGKTTIMTEINNRLLEGRDFDLVIWVSAPKEPSLVKLQKGIGEKLELDLSMIDDDVTRAAKLFEALNRRRRYTLILDDLWEPFSLETAGIPIPTVENGCKLVITTRLLSVCRGMETDEDVEVKALQDDEAWDLLRYKVGMVVSNSPEVEMIAKEVTKECGGLPLAIVTVGRALRNAADVSEWECALAELRASTANIERMEETVFAHLRFSYAKLKDDTSRSCFLFCALYPESHQIDTNELMEYWMWEGLLGYVGGISAIKRRGKIILNELKHACLLEGVTQNAVEFVRMHDLIRDMAITIMRTNPHCISKAGTRMTKHQWMEEWTEDVQRVSLMRNDLKCIPFNYNLMFPRLTSLLFQFNSFSENISHEFFENMQFLKVLDLSYTGIDFLPNSVSNLDNLSALLLSNCWNLSTVPSLAKLNKLMVLDLSCSPRMKELPNGMQNLGNLRRLNISKTGIEIFPFGLISKFTLLEDLLIGGCGILWGSMTVKAISGGATIEEVISLNLSSLELDLWNADVFDQYAKSVHWVQLDKFRITVGQPQAQFYEERSLAFSGRFVLRGNPVSLPPNTLELHLDDSADIKHLSMCLVNVAQLKSCKIRWCDNIEGIIDSEEEENTLSMLERMELLVLGNLKMICRDEVRPGTLTSLKIITVEYCPKLKTLFSGQLLLQLRNLEEISVRSCTGMEYIMKGEERDFMGGNGSRIEFPKLKRMKLKFMPLLESIYDGTIFCPSLRSLEVASCEALKRLPLDLSTTPALEEIKATRTWWNSLAWDQPNSKDILQPYFVEIRLTSTSDR
ncbi:disease resistance protein At4g27190-like [Prosopis cineraria]|uniref:disease resistance protein At4g27190-like n=1 Tax=Prosopis cineraria TaxID=364024 RepID=UPI00240EB30E|nr:disease resistance protein At4g27190-like [Prosopis cineraria]